MYLQKAFKCRYTHLKQNREQDVATQVAYRKKQHRARAQKTLSAHKSWELFRCIKHSRHASCGQVTYAPGCISCWKLSYKSPSVDYCIVYFAIWSLSICILLCTELCINRRNCRFWEEVIGRHYVWVTSSSPRTSAMRYGCSGARNGLLYENVKVYLHYLFTLLYRHVGVQTLEIIIAPNKTLKLLW